MRFETHTLFNFKSSFSIKTHRVFVVGENEETQRAEFFLFCFVRRSDDQFPADADISVSFVHAQGVEVPAFFNPGRKELPEMLQPVRGQKIFEFLSYGVVL